MSAPLQRRILPPSRAVFVYAGACMLGGVALESGKGRVAALAAELGALLWPRLDVAAAADAVPSETFRPFRHALAAWRAGVDGTRRVLHDQVQALDAPLSEALTMLLGDPEVPALRASDAVLAVIRLPDVAEAWAQWQFEARELAVLGMLAWAGEIIPRMDGGTIEAAWVRVAVAAGIVALAGIDDDDEEPEAGGLNLVHGALAELAEAVPSTLWPSFAAIGEHHTAPMATAGHG